jgi:hypothetical protein
MQAKLARISAQRAQSALSLKSHLAADDFVLIPGLEVWTALVAALHESCHIVLVHIDGAVVGFVLLIVFVVCTKITVRLHDITPFLWSADSGCFLPVNTVRFPRGHQWRQSAGGSCAFRNHGGYFFLIQLSEELL